MKAPRGKVGKSKSKITKNIGLFQSLKQYCLVKGFTAPLGGDGEDGKSQELVFAKELGRKYAFDCCWPDRMLAIEFQGGGNSGRHCSWNGYSNDCLKTAYAVAMGWKLYPITTDQVKKGMAYAILDFEFDHKDQNKLAAELNEISKFYKAKTKNKNAASILRKIGAGKRVERRKKTGKDK